MKLRLGLSLYLVCLPLLANEQQDMDKLLSMSLSELGNLRVTSATLTEETLLSVPSAMSLYRREDIQTLGVIYLHQLAALVPGFQTQRMDDSGLNATLSARGRHLGASSREVLVLIDGQRINDDWTGGSNFQDRLINIENAERIEFIRGPGSAIYGSNALMGVINIVTGGARALKLGGGSQGVARASGQWQFGDQTRNLALFGALEQRDGHNYLLSEPSPDPATPDFVNARDPAELGDLYLKASFDDFRFSGRYQRRRSHDFYVVGYVAGDTGKANSDSWHTSLGWQHSWANAISLSGQLSYSHKNIELYAPTQLAHEPIFRPLQSIFGRVEEQEWATQWTLQGPWQQARWLLGWEWRNPTLTDTSGAIVPHNGEAPTLFDLSAADGRTVQGLFGQLQYPLLDTLQLTLGLRYDNYSDFGGHTSPRVALVQQLGDQHSLKLMYSEAFRAPSRVETGSRASDVLTANPDLRPEVAKTLELLWAHQWAAGLFSISLYDTELKDAVLDSFVAQPEPVRTWVNGSQHISGAELEWQYQWLPHWQSRLALSHIFHPGLELNTEASSLASMSLNYADGPWSAALYATWVSAKKDANEQDYPQDVSTVEYTRLGSRATLGMHLAWQWRPQLRVTLHGDNLLDAEYLDVAIRPNNAVGVPGPGRSWMLGLEWTPR